MKVSDALRGAAAALNQTSSSPRLDAELLMAHAMGVSRSDLLLRHLGDTSPKRFTDLVARREQSEPVAYLTGCQEFYGREFLVTRDTLIPRSDSETLIDVALKEKPNAERVLDLGTGTGALLLSFVAETNASGVGIDQSVAAVGVADKNASRLGLENRVTLRGGDWSEIGWSKRIGTFDLILCNPPYVETDAKLDRDVREYEPAQALFAGPDGLDDYRIIVPQLRGLLAENGVALFEIGHTQDASVAEIAAEVGFLTTLHRDLAHRPRALLLR